MNEKNKCVNKKFRIFVLVAVISANIIFPKEDSSSIFSTPDDKTISTIALAGIVAYFGWNIFRSFVKFIPKEQNEEVEEILNEIQFIITKSELKKFKSLRTQEERNIFLKDFWKKRDPTPQTAVNEFKIQHESRVNYCNDNFTTGLKEGASTDMGRVYILFGPPFNILRDEIDTSNDIFSKFSPNVYPLEVWVYDFPSVTTGLPTIFSNTNYGGTFFVFMDLQKVGEYTQVYSNKPNEYIDNRVYR